MIGFSLGGVVAFEMARELEAARQPVGLIALIRFAALRRERAFTSGQATAAARLETLAQRRGRTLAISRCAWRLLLARLRRHNLSHQPDDRVLGLDCPPHVAKWPWSI